MTTLLSVHLNTIRLMIYNQTFASHVIASLVAAANSNYAGEYRRRSLQIAPGAVEFQKTNSPTALSFTNLSHSFGMMASNVHVGHPEAGTVITEDDVKCLSHLSWQFMHIAGSFLRESWPAVVNTADLFITRTGKVFRFAEAVLWPTSKNEGLIQSWAHELVEILRGHSSLPSSVGAESKSLKKGRFEIKPNDARIVQLAHLIKQIKGDHNHEVRGRAGTSLIAVMYMLMYSTGQIPDDVEFVSLGVNEHGYIIGCRKESAE